MAVPFSFVLKLMLFSRAFLVICQLVLGPCVTLCQAPAILETGPLNWSPIVPTATVVLQ